jgi:hypothetical protein
MMPPEYFTAYDPATRLILYSGTTENAALLPDPAFPDVRADPASYRVTVDLSGIEPKPEVPAALSATEIDTGNSIEVTAEVLVRISVDGTVEADGVLEAELVFETAGVYRVHVETLDRLFLPLASVVTVTDP